MAEQQGFADDKLSADQLKAAGYQDAPLAWPERYPKTATVVNSALNTLPVMGAAAGGILATPETAGVGAPAGVVLGAGVGKGARDLLAHILGLESTTPGQKAAGIEKDMLTTAGFSALAAAAPLLKVPTGKVLQFGGRFLQKPLKATGQLVEDVGDALAKPSAPPPSSPVMPDFKPPTSAPSATGTAWAPGAMPASAASEGSVIGKGLAEIQQSKIKLDAAEWKQSMDWLRSGVPGAEVLDRINAARAFNAKFKDMLPTPQQVADLVKQRNANGRW